MSRGIRYTVSALFRLGLAGIFATAIALGLARNDYGLFLPYLWEGVAFSTGLLGFIASGFYAGHLVALSAVGLLAPRMGRRLLVLTGLLSAALGMAAGDFGMERRYAGGVSSFGWPERRMVVSPSRHRPRHR